MNLSDVKRGAGRFAIALAALGIAACQPAVKTEAEAPKGPKGLPMWVISDKDSTIYLTGTVHMLPPDLDWKSEKLLKAVDKADEMWLEVPMKSDVQAMAQEMMPLMAPYMFAKKPLNKLLTEEEMKKLDEAIARAKLPDGASQGLKLMQPWMINQMIGMGPLMASGYDENSGVDVTLVKMAEEQKDTVRGFETFEQQIKMIAGQPEDKQVEALRKAINMPPEESDKMMKQADAAFQAWANGDMKPAEDLFATIASSDEEKFSGMDVETMIYNRNADWANQIEKLLKEEDGVSFIAVGAGHLVGPKNLRELLAAKGIEAKPY